jgi:hypothetical protein
MVKSLLSLAAVAQADTLSGHYQGSVPFIINVESTFNGDATADVLVDVKVASVKFDCKSEAITETDSLVTFTNTAQDGDCLGDGIRSDSKDPSKYTIKKNGDGSLTFTSDGYPDLKLEKKALAVADDDNLGFKMHYSAPKDAGTYPVILFVSGFSGDAPAFAYGDVVNQLVGHGFIVVGMDHLKIPDYPTQGQDFHDIMEWAAAGHLQEALKNAGISAVADLERVAVMGQSAGNHVVGQGLTDGCSLAKAMVMIDPVDGFDPFGIIAAQNLITPGEKLKFTIPSLLLDNELDPKGKNLLFPACAPAKLGAPRWFDAAAGPVWNVNASSYGHVDCLDDLFIAAGKLVCPSDRKTDKKAYRTYLADTVALFLDGVLNGNTDKFSLLEDATKFNIAVTLRSDLKGQSHKDIKAGCSNTAVVV